MLHLIAFVSWNQNNYFLFSRFLVRSHEFIVIISRGKASACHTEWREMEVEIFAKLADGWMEPVPATEKIYDLLFLFFFHHPTLKREVWTNPTNPNSGNTRVYIIHQYQYQPNLRPLQTKRNALYPTDERKLGKDTLYHYLTLFVCQQREGERGISRGGCVLYSVYVCE